ncbi:MAG: hypothetical protein LBQ09_04215, partial [Acidobacteriaceae bacterium]|nr:hypothetical protein [Acidobacteriaceae bacterium]
MNLILLEADEIGEGGAATLSGSRAEHAIRVLHVEPGHHIRVGVLDGPAGSARVVAVASGAVTIACAFEADTLSRPRVDLLLAL